MKYLGHIILLLLSIFYILNGYFSGSYLSSGAYSMGNQEVYHTILLFVLSIAQILIFVIDIGKRFWIKLVLQFMIFLSLINLYYLFFPITIRHNNGTYIFYTVILWLIIIFLVLGWWISKKNLNKEHHENTINNKIDD